MFEIKPQNNTSFVYALLSMLFIAISLLTSQRPIVMFVFIILTVVMIYATWYYSKTKIVINNNILKVYGIKNFRSVDLAKLTSAKVFISDNGLNLELKDERKILTLEVSAYSKEDSAQLFQKLKPFVLANGVDKSKNLGKLFN